MRSGSRFVTVGLLDQGLSSVATLILSLSVLNLSPVSTAASFSAALIVYGLAVALSRSLASEPFAVFHQRSQLSLGDEAKAHVVASLPVGALALVLMTAMGVLADPLGGVTAGAVMAGVAADSVRSTYLAAGNAAGAAIRSVLVSVVTGLSAVVAFALHEPFIAIVGWLVAASGIAIAALLSPSQHRWWRGLLPETFSYAIEFAVTSGASQVALLIAVLIVGDSFSVTQRVLVTLFGPYLSLFQALAIVAIPLLVRSTVMNPRTRRGRVKGAGVFALVLWVALLAWGGVATLIASSWGSGVFGASWSVASPYIGTYFCSLIPGAAVAGVFLAARASADTRRSLRIRVVSGILQLFVPIVGAIAAGIFGFYIGVTIAAATVAAYGFFNLWGMKGDHRNGDRPRDANY